MDRSFNSPRGARPFGVVERGNPLFSRLVVRLKLKPARENWQTTRLQVRGSCVFPAYQHEYFIRKQRQHNYQTLLLFLPCALQLSKIPPRRNSAMIRHKIFSRQTFHVVTRCKSRSRAGTDGRLLIFATVQSSEQHLEKREKGE